MIAPFNEPAFMAIKHEIYHEFQTLRRLRAILMNSQFQDYPIHLWERFKNELLPLIKQRKVEEAAKLFAAIEKQRILEKYK